MVFVIEGDCIGRRKDGIDRDVVVRIIILVISAKDQYTTAP